MGPMDACVPSQPAFPPRALLLRRLPFLLARSRFVMRRIILTSSNHSLFHPKVLGIDGGGDSGLPLKIRLSMKYVSQGDGRDFDPDHTQAAADAERGRGGGGGFGG